MSQLKENRELAGKVTLRHLKYTMTQNTSMRVSRFVLSPVLGGTEGRRGDREG